MFRNTLCVDAACEKGCAHLGPQGRHCFFEVEKHLCSALGIPWHQGLRLEDLCRQVAQRLNTHDPEELLSRITERMAPNTQLTAPEEPK